MVIDIKPVLTELQGLREGQEQGLQALLTGIEALTEAVNGVREELKGVREELANIDGSFGDLAEGFTQLVPVLSGPQAQG